LDQLAKFRDGLMGGADLLAADDHVAECPECREKLDAVSASLANWDSVAQSFTAAVESAEPHVSYQSLQAYVDRTISPAESIRVEAHLMECPGCRREADNLQAFAAGLSSGQPKRSRFNRYLILAPIAATLLVGVLLMRPHDKPVGPKAAVGADEMAAALRDGKLAVHIPAGLGSAPSVLLGGRTAAPKFRAESPVGQMVLEETPVFRWDGVAGARSYKVQVFDTNYQPVLTSGAVTGTSWTPERPLERGKRYVWQTTALRPGGDIKAPEPPDAEARFEIVSSAEAGAIEQARRKGAGHLELTELYAHAGLCREAIDEARGLPVSAAAQQIQSSLAAQCGRTAQSQ
jgi:hypothetical protein